MIVERQGIILEVCPDELVQGIMAANVFFQGKDVSFYVEQGACMQATGGPEYILLSAELVGEVVNAVRGAAPVFARWMISLTGPE